MGLFSKLKANMNHGGVKLALQVPSSVAADQVIPVQVTLTADSAQTINGVKAELKAQEREQGMMMGGNNGGVGMQNSRTNYQTVGQVENREQFTIAPGETKTIELQLFAGGAANFNPAAQLGNVGGQLGGVLQSVASVVQTLDHVSYMYSVHASADVDGVSLDPSDKQSIQILPATAEPTQTVAQNPTQPAPIQAEAMPLTPAANPDLPPNQSL